ncbi:MAG TPA: D-alanine--D-alanine ligase [Ignavibacteria bacterium]
MIIFKEHMISHKNLNILLLVGGLSAEREVSLSSGRAILKALRENGHKVKVADPIYGSEEVSEEKIFQDYIKRDYPTKDSIRLLQKISSRKMLDCINSKLLDNIDLVFIGLHGKFGEDGKIQTLLELRGVKYSGSGVFSSNLSMDKDFSKVIMKFNGIKTPDWITFYKSEEDSLNEITNKINSSFGYPCVIKPNDEGSTVGLTILFDEDNEKLSAALELAFSYSEKIIIEKYIKGRELTVPVIGTDSYHVIEIIPKDGFYDYEHKYSKGRTDYICPADISELLEIEARQIAVNAHKSLECEVYSRVDFILNENNELYCLEVNTLPGMTDTSLVPKSALKSGINFNQLIEKIINLSIRK